MVFALATRRPDDYPFDRQFFHGVFEKRQIWCCYQSSVALVNCFERWRGKILVLAAHDLKGFKVRRSGDNSDLTLLVKSLVLEEWSYHKKLFKWVFGEGWVFMIKKITKQLIDGVK